MISITPDKKTELAVLETVKALSLPPKKRERILAKASKASVKQSKKNARAQKTPNGSPWEKRKSRRKGKMQSGISRYMTVTKVSASGATIGWKVAQSAKVAFIHHHGIDQKGSKAQSMKGLKKNGVNSDSAATRTQAKRLRELDYKVFSRRLSPKGRKGKLRKPPLKWITENLSVGQAGLIIRILSDKSPLSRWDVPMPARPFAEIDREALTTMTRNEMRGQK